MAQLDPGAHLIQVPSADIGRAVVAWQRMWDRLPEWRGVRCQQFTTDLWRYAELCFEYKPPFVVEVGTAEGGTALFLGDILGIAGGGQVITVDVAPVHLRHPRVTVVTGDAADPAVVAQVMELAAGRRGIVLLDGLHEQAQVAAELDAYAGLADYLVCEDTLMRWLPGYQDRTGPWEALGNWLPAHPEFTVEAEPVPTNHPGGWLRRAA